MDSTREPQRRMDYVSESVEKGQKRPVEPDHAFFGESESNSANRIGTGETALYLLYRRDAVDRVAPSSRNPRQLRALRS